MVTILVLITRLVKRQLDENRKLALLGKHGYSSVAIRYKVARYVGEIVVKFKIYLHL